MSHERHQLTGSEVARGKSPLSLRQQFLVLIITSAMLLAYFVPMHMSLVGSDMSPLRMGMLIVGDTGVIGLQIAFFLVLFARWRRTRTEAAGPR